MPTTDDFGLTWHDDFCAPQVEVPGVNGSILYEDAPRIVEATWKLASWLSSGNFMFQLLDGTRLVKSHRDVHPLPRGAVSIPNGGDHDHCLASFCGVSIWRSADPETCLAWYSETLDRWLCRGCHDAIMRHLEAIRRGLIERGFAVDGA